MTLKMNGICYILYSVDGIHTTVISTESVCKYRLLLLLMVTLRTHAIWLQVGNQSISSVSDVLLISCMLSIIHLRGVIPGHYKYHNYTKLKHM